MGSTRLAGKVLRKILGQEVLLRQVQRIRRARTVQDVVVITSVEARDEAIASFCEANGIPVYRGSENDLLDRHYQAARKFDADFVAKIPSDCPLADPAIIDDVLGLWLDAPDRYDYVSNYHPATFPDGLDVEGCPIAVLETAWKEARRPHEREHTFPFIWDQPARFRVGNVANPCGNLFMTNRWTLDYPEDFEFIERIFESFRDREIFSMSDVLELLGREPALAEINRKHAGVNWYREVGGSLKTVPRREYRRTGPLRLSASLELLERAKRAIPCATQTLSKGYTQWSPGAAPNFIRSARGCEVTDVDGNVYVDYGMALGPFILGYGDPEVDAAVRAQLDDGTMFTLPHPLEVEAAERIIEVVPCAEMVRFAKNGSDATSAAVKLARAHTGREKIVVCGYHGWQDWYIATTERDRGVPRVYKELVFSMQYNDIGSLERVLEKHGREIAAVIMEPVYVSPPDRGFLEAVREITAKRGIVLIFDELFTGFRWALGGAQEYFRVTPDLACFGKAAANGYPVSFVAGRREIMRQFEEVFFSFTYGGEALSLAAIVATIRKLRDGSVHRHVWDMGQRIKDGVESRIRDRGLEKQLGLIGYPVKTAFDFKGAPTATPLEMKTFFQQECAARGVLFIGYHLPSYAHKEEDVDFTLRVYDEVFDLFGRAVESGSLRSSLRGPVLTQIFKNVGDRSAGIAD